MREAKEKKQPETTSTAAMEGVSKELERRSQHLSFLIQRTKIEADEDEKRTEKPPLAPREDKHSETRPAQLQQREETMTKKKGPAASAEGDGVGFGDPKADEQQQQQNVRVRAADMPSALQKRAFWCARQTLAAMPKLDSKRLALALKKEFDSSYGPAWHCIVGTSFGSYVTHSVGGFLYFSIDKVYILLFRTAVEPLHR